MTAALYFNPKTDNSCGIGPAVIHVLLPLSVIPAFVKTTLKLLFCLWLLAPMAFAFWADRPVTGSFDLQHVDGTGKVYHGTADGSVWQRERAHEQAHFYTAECRETENEDESASSNRRSGTAHITSIFSSPATALALPKISATYPDEFHALGSSVRYLKLCVFRI